MNGNALETAGTVSSGGTVSLAVTLAWLGVNATAIGVIIAILTMLMTGLFYVASIHLKRIEIEVKTDKVKAEIMDEFYQKIASVETTDERKHEAKQMLKDVLNRRDV